MTASLVLVSAYINIESREKDLHNRLQTFSVYRERGQKLINIPIPKIIFIDTEYIDEFQGNDDTILIPITLEELDIYPFYKQILATENGITCLSPNPIKDTVLFHLIQIAKTEFVSKAIDLHYILEDDFINMNATSNTAETQSPVFGWIDFGISKIFKSDEEFINVVSTLPARINDLQNNGKWHHDMIKIPGCWNLNPVDNTEFDMIKWYFCGGFFLGGKEILKEFEKEVKKELDSILAEHKKIIFEVNIWFRIWKRGGICMDWYYGDHNASMLVI